MISLTNCSGFAPPSATAAAFSDPLCYNNMGLRLPAVAVKGCLTRGTEL
jgi:hypothetical protein